VLVVDDNPDGALALAEVLRVSGHEVRVAHTGPAALTEAAAFRPGTVFLDIGLPGMDGYAVARRLRDRPGPDRPVLVALTGYGQAEDHRRSREAGFDHHLVKPVDPDALLALLAAGDRPDSGLP
jgi:CheY-like chemotaxis protein